MAKAKPKKVVPGVKKKFEKFDLMAVGMKYHTSKQQRLQLLNLLESEGDLLCYLEPEPENPVDPKAIKILLSSGSFLGYVQRPVNEPLFDLMNKGAIIQSCWLTALDPFEGIGNLKVTLKKPPDR